MTAKKLTVAAIALANIAAMAAMQESLEYELEYEMGQPIVGESDYVGDTGMSVNSLLKSRFSNVDSRTA